MLTKRSEKQLSFFCKDFEPRLGGGQKYSKNRSKSSNKWKCHEGKEVSDCDGLQNFLVGKANHSKVEGENHLHPVTEVISKRSD